AAPLAAARRQVLPPPPRRPPLSLELLPLLQPPPLLLPPDQPPLVPPLDGVRSMIMVRMNARAPATSAMPKLPSRNQASTATTPPVAIEPNRRPSAPRKMLLITNAKNSQNGLNASKLELSQCGGSGSGSFSPLIRPIMRLTPAEMPPAKSPLLNFGVMISSIMRLEVTSVSTPSRP